MLGVTKLVMIVWSNENKIKLYEKKVFTFLLSNDSKLYVLKSTTYLRL